MARQPGAKENNGGSGNKSVQVGHGCSGFIFRDFPPSPQQIYKRNAFSKPYILSHLLQAVLEVMGLEKFAGLR
ncbi:MAG: hypothetical protein IID15_05825 [Candidatus Marinimicrobia bacterium]|nr:hypothetical protein [Candidatus Neomarinimicrobiota bacterium]